MEEFEKFLSNINPISNSAMKSLWNNFQPSQLSAGEYFVREGEYAQRIGFLKSGIVRAFFLNQEGKEYNKQFFIGPSIIGPYTALLTKQANQIAQQALTDCIVYVANYTALEKLYDEFHEIERLGRKLAEYYFLEKEQKELEMALLDADKRYLIMRERFPSIESRI